MEKFELSVVQKDALIEVASIGTGNASTILSNLTGKLVKLTTPAVDIIDIKQIPKFVGGRKKMVVSVYWALSGDIRGKIMVIYPIESALSLADLAQKKELGTTKILETNEQTVIKDLTSSILVCYVDALTKFLGFKVSHDAPRFVSTFGKEIVDFAVLDLPEDVECTILLKTTFTVEPDLLEGDFIILLPIVSISKLLDLINKKMVKEL